MKLPTPVTWRPWWLVLLFVFSLPAVTPRIYASDEIQYFAYLRSLWFDHDVSFENEYRHFYERGIAQGQGFHETFLERTTDTGRRLNFGTIGCALLWAPFYGAADLAIRAGVARGAPWAADGYSLPYVAAVAYASALYGFLAILISARIATEWLGRGTLGAALVWVGTPLLFYMYLAPPMSHACSAFAVALFVAVWLRVRRRWSAPGLAGLGLLAALMAMVREQDAFVVVGPAIDFGLTFARRLTAKREPGEPDATRLLANAAAGVGAGLLGFAPQALAYLSLNGYIGPSRLVARKMTWSAPHALAVLFSPAHGFFVWTPLALIGLAGLAWLLVARPAETGRSRDLGVVALCLMVIFLVQVYIAGSVESWTVAGAFGQRRFVAVTVVLVFGLAAAGRWARQPWTRRLLIGLTGVCVWWNLGLMLQFGAGLMDRQRLEPANNAYVSFVVLPRRLPELAYRYLFERETFYRSPPG